MSNTEEKENKLARNIPTIVIAPPEVKKKLAELKHKINLELQKICKKNNIIDYLGAVIGSPKVSNSNDKDRNEGILMTHHDSEDFESIYHTYQGTGFFNLGKDGFLKCALSMSESEIITIPYSTFSKSDLLETRNKCLGIKKGFSLTYRIGGVFYYGCVTFTNDEYLNILENVEAKQLLTKNMINAPRLLLPELVAATLFGPIACENTLLVDSIKKHFNGIKIPLTELL